MTAGRIRTRLRRRAEEAEEEAEEGGEINLVPFLDIVTNVIMFLLATISVILPMGNINVGAPRYAAAGAAGSSDQPVPDKPPLQLTVTVTGTGFIIAGSGGVLYQNNEAGKLPTIPKTPKGEYDYPSLVGMVGKLKDSFPDESNVILVANPDIPYEVVVRVMDTLRERPGKRCTQACKDKQLTAQGCNPDDLIYAGECLFPEVVLGAGVE